MRVVSQGTAAGHSREFGGFAPEFHAQQNISRGRQRARGCTLSAGLVFTMEIASA
jgi:hypothetical protein